MIDERNEQLQERQEQDQKELIKCQEALAKSQEQLRYLQADFENFRRNVTRERMQWARAAQIPFVEDLISIRDDIERALAQMQHDREGIELVYRNLSHLLAKHGVTEITAEGVFDPVQHEALVQVEAENMPAGTIVQVLQKGYMFKDAVVRPAKVSVAK
jgi:molecular chaperone GrpE